VEVVIERIALRNFQKHEKKGVDLDPGVTCFVGDTGAGKSSFFRAFEFALLNRPGYVRDGCPFTSVLIKVDGRKVFRKKGKGVNLYSLDGKKFVAFKTEVPEEIARLLNVGPVNFQKQLDLPYWFTETAGKVSKNLNEIVNLEVIDKTIEKVNSLVRSRRNELEVTENRVSEARKEVKELEWVVDLGRDVEGLKSLEDHHARIRSRIASAGRLIGEASRVSRRVNDRSEAILGARKALDAFRPYTRARRKARVLGKLVTELELAQKRMNREIPDLTELRRVRKQGDLAAEKRRVLEEILSTITEQEEIVCRTEKELRQRQKSQTHCPTCGQELP
jgi:hypothetical protein